LKKRRNGGDPILAARSGFVKMAKRIRGYRLMILLEHDDGTRTRYAHLSRKKVNTGQRVSAGEEIGTVGATGRATTPHLHFEIITRSGRAINPRPYVTSAHPVQVHKKKTASLRTASVTQTHPKSLAKPYISQKSTQTVIITTCPAKGIINDKAKQALPLQSEGKLKKPTAGSDFKTSLDSGTF